MRVQALVRGPLAQRRDVKKSSVPSSDRASWEAALQVLKLFACMRLPSVPFGGQSSWDGR